MVALQLIAVMLAFSGNENIRENSNNNKRVISRRDIIEYCGTFATISLFQVPLPASASDVRAPIECLYPATRVRMYIDEAVKVASEGSIEQLNDILLVNPPSSFILSEEEIKSSDTYRRIKTQDAWNKARRLEREERGARLGIDYTTPYDKANTAIQEMGRKRQFQLLRNRQLNLEKRDPIRAALNTYTNNLIFGDSYQLNAQGVERKQMIRSDATPNVDAVVVSDLDLRDLYRNQVLQNMEDARFELKYQLEQPRVDLQEVLEYLQQAQKSCESWFGFIPTEDVKQAMLAVKR